MQRIGYDPERDLLHPTGSVFCSHGAGFEVKWDEVDRMAHLPLLDFREKEEGSGSAEADRPFDCPGRRAGAREGAADDFRADVWAN